MIAGAIGYLAVTLTSPQTPEQHNAAATERLEQWKGVFETYRESNGGFPDVPEGGYCLGTGFPIGTGGTANCRDYAHESFYTEQASAPLMEQLGSVGDLPNGPDRPVGGTVGPWALFQDDRVDLITAEEGGCADPAVDVWSDDAGRHVCVISLPR